MLKGGISIDHLKIASYNIEGLYLKLDKKLILKVNKFIIPKIKKRNKVLNIERELDRLKKILDFFEYIKLKEVNFKNDHYTFLYSDHIIYMTSDQFEIALHRINHIGDELQAIVDLLYIKKYDARISGKLVYNYKQDMALFHGGAQYRDINLEFIINKRKERFYYVIKSNRFTQLKSLIEQFHLPHNISVWITDKVLASSYRLDSLKGIIQVGKNSIDIMPNSIIAKAKLEDPLIYFQNGIEPVKAKELYIYFRNGNLYFDLKDPYYLADSLDGSNLSILGLGDLKRPILKLKLKFNTTFDDKIHKILNSYNIHIPIEQDRGEVDSRLHIDIELKTKRLEYYGDFGLKKGTLSIGGGDFPVTEGRVEIKDHIAILKDIKLKNNAIDSTVNGKVYIDKKRANLSLNIKNLYLGDKKSSFVSMKDKNLSMKIDYKNSIYLSVPSLKTSLKISKDSNTTKIVMRDLKKIKENIQSLPLNIDGGDLKIETTDYKKYTFSGILKRSDCFFYEKDTECLIQIPIYGFFNSDNLLLRAFGDRFIFDTQKSIINVKNLNLDLKRYFEVQKQKKSKKEQKSIKQRVKIIAEKSTLKYDTYRLVTDSYELGILPSGDFHFRGKLKYGEKFRYDEMIVTKKGDRLDIKADRIHDKMLHPLINFNGLQNGRYSVKISGMPGKYMEGTIILDGGVISNFKAYNNVLAFINTIPALATLHSPGYSTKGFKIKQGLIKFNISDDNKLFFDSLLIESDSATISGDGIIDLKSGKIDIDLAIQTAKPMGKLISTLPVVGYILTGDKKSIVTVGLHIGGTIDDPKVDISPVKDVLMLPIKMIERTLKGRKGSSN